MAVHIGDTFKNRYKIIEPLGRGGMADVYKVWDEERSTYLALKLLRDDLAQDPVFMRRFRREAHNLAQLQHPNIVRFYGLEEDDLKAFILMEYIEGPTLREEIRRAGSGGLALERVQSIMEDVCSALQYAHNKGLVHCDIKSGNILIDASGRAYLTDFGIARGMDAATSTMVGVGTPAYMAPELIKGQDPTPQTDIYALGIVLYEMLTGGERPFTGERAGITGTTAEKVRWEHLKLSPFPISRFNPNVNTNLHEVLKRCLQKNPEERYNNVLNLLEAVRRTGKERKFSEVKSKKYKKPEYKKDAKIKKAPKELERKKVKKKKWEWISLLIIGIGIIYLIQNNHATNPKINDQIIETVSFSPSQMRESNSGVDTPTVITNEKEMEMPGYLEELESGEVISRENVAQLSGELIYSPKNRSTSSWQLYEEGIIDFSKLDNNLFVFINTNEIILFDLNKKTEISSFKTQLAINDIDFFNSAPKMVSGSEGQELVFWDYRNGEILHTVDGSISWTDKARVTSVAVSPNDQLVANGSNDSLRLWDANSGRLLDVLDGKSNHIMSVTFSPDGKYLASGSREGKIQIWNVEDSKLTVQKKLMGHTGPITSLEFSPDGKLLASGTNSLVKHNSEESVSDCSVRIWDVNNTELVHLLVHEKPITDIAFSNDGNMLVTSSWDGIYFWNVENGELLLSKEISGGYISSLDFSNDGKFLLTFSNAHGIYLWSITNG